eukprot:12384966-Prorocentrum_lima.AAC.1
MATTEIYTRRQRQMCIRDSEKSASHEDRVEWWLPEAWKGKGDGRMMAVSYTHLRAHETRRHL